MTNEGKIQTMAPVIRDDQNVGIAVRTIREFFN
jgi:hypothetical protein